MGVKGFDNFIKDYRIKGETINWKYEAEVKRKNGQQLVIGFDGNNLLYSILRKKDILVNIGSYIVIKRKIKRYLKQFLDLGIKVVVFLDGIPPPTKPLDDRYHKRTKDTIKIGNHLIHGQPLGSITPCLQYIQFKQVLSDLNIDCHVAYNECDDYIMQWAVDNNAFAVLSGDSDFYFFQIQETFFIPLDTIRIDSRTSELVGIGYKPHQLAYTLGINPLHMPLLATIIGNDYTDHIVNNSFGERSTRIDTIVKALRPYYQSDSLKYILENIGQHRYKDKIDEVINATLYYELNGNPGGSMVIKNGLKYMLPEDPSYQDMASKPWFNHFFSVNNTSSLKDLAFLRNGETNTGRIQSFEGEMAFDDSFLKNIIPVVQKVIGLITFNLDINIYNIIVPNYNGTKVLNIPPIKGKLGMDDYWSIDNPISLESKITEYLEIFGISPRGLVHHFTDPTICIDDLILVSNCIFLLNSKQKSINITLWMIEAIVLQYVFLQHKLYPLYVSLIYEHTIIKRNPFMVFDFYQNLYQHAGSVLELLNIVNRFKSPHSKLEYELFESIWTIMENNDVDNSKETSEERFNRLFDINKWNNDTKKQKHKVVSQEYSKFINLINIGLNQTTPDLTNLSLN